MDKRSTTVVFLGFGAGAVMALLLSAPYWSPEPSDVSTLEPMVYHTDPENDLRFPETVNDHESKMAWLLSFPGSGADYVLDDIAVSSQRATGTNYVEDINPPVAPLWLDEKAPYVLNALKVPPDGFVLTKTLCSEHGQSPPVLDMKTFLTACATYTYVSEDGSIANSTYSPALASKAVHLFRDPIDSIVALKVESQKIQTATNEEWSNQDVIDDMQRWCEEMDNENTWFEKVAHNSRIDPELYEGLPCRSLFFRFTQWHNVALQVVERIGIPSHGLYYEKYMIDYATTARGLMGFLNLSPVETLAASFSGLPTYESSFPPATRVRIGSYVKGLATKACWHHLKRYFEHDD